MSVEYYDILGQPIREGSFIAYAAVQGSSPRMRLGKVKQLKKANVGSIEEPKLGVVAAEKTTTKWERDHRVIGWELLNHGKDITIYIYNVVVVQKDQMPSDVMILLEV